MADLRLDLSRIDRDIGSQFDDEDDLHDEDHIDDIDPLMDDLSPDDRLTALERVEKYFQSEDMGDRDMANRIVPEALQTVENLGQFELLLEIAFALANDHEPYIRIGVLNNLASLLDRNSEFSDEGEDMVTENEERLFDVPIMMLTDINQQVRRVAQNCIVVLLEEEKGSRDVLLQQLCPTVKRCLGRDENYDLRMDTALLISRIAPLLGRELCLQHFVPLLPPLCTDTMFHVRKAFAMSCKDLCPVLGEDASEEHILPLFLKLCKDEVWGVRKACADVFPDISLACNLGTRHDRLTPNYLKLLHDESRWVRKAAYQSLGPFISTFYVPNSETPSPENVSIDPLGDSMLMDNSLVESSALTTTGNSSTEDSNSENRHPLPNPPDSIFSNSSTPVHSNGPGNGKGSTSSQRDTESGSQFSNFEFWRSPIPKVDGDSRVDKLAESLQDLSPEDLEDSPGSKPNDTEGLRSGKDGLNSSVQGRLNFDDKTDCLQDIEGANNMAQVTVGTEKKSEEQKQVEAQDEAESKVNEEPVSKKVQDEQSSLQHNEPSLGGDDALKSESTQHASDHQPQPSSTTSTADKEVSTTSTADKKTSASQDDSKSSSPSVAVSSASSNGPPTEPPPRLSETAREGTPRGTDVAVAVDDAMRIRSCSAGSSLRTELGSNLMFEEEKKGPGETKKRRWSLDKMNKLQENNTLPPVRVFIHSTNGQIMEQDLSTVGHEPLPSLEASIGGVATEEVGLHDYTTNKSMEMDLTGVESVPSEPNLAAFQQEIVPDELMEIYLSMNETAKAQNVDTDLPYYCAYSLPGVALTLGKGHWPMIKPTFDVLAADMHWKIRRVLAFSLHEMARVLGTEQTCSDILPIFEDYSTKDCDDVKIGTLTHLTEFFEMLPSEARSGRLPGVLRGLQDNENEKNWRYRNTLAEQLIQLCDLYDTDYLQAHLYPIAKTLAEDKVAEVRATATQLLGVLLQKLAESSLERCRSLLQELKAYSSHERWLYRLMYVKQCEVFLLDGRISCEMFASECLPTLIHLARDKVPNVRIAVAKMLKDSVLGIDYFQTDGKETFSLEELQITLECLQHDVDKDVKYFAGGDVTDTPRILMLPVHWVPQRGHSDSQLSQSTSSDSELPYHDAVEHLEGDHPISDETSVSQSATAPPTSPTSSAPVSISSPDEVMEQLLHHQLEELESSHRHDDVTQDDTEDINVHVCSHDGSIFSGHGHPEGSTPADNVQDKMEEVVTDEPVKSEEPKPKPPLKGGDHSV